MAYLLLIDDDVFLIPEQVRRALPPASYWLVVAGTGAAGLEIVRTEPPDVILLDLLLPDSRVWMSTSRSVASMHASR